MPLLFAELCFARGSGVGGANSQSVTTIFEDFKRSANCAGDAICIVFDILENVWKRNVDVVSVTVMVGWMRNQEAAACRVKRDSLPLHSPS